MSRSIKPSSDMRSLRRPQGVVASREASSDGRIAERSANKQGRNKQIQINKAKRQKTSGPDVIPCYNQTRSITAKICITPTDVLELIDADMRTIIFSWKTVLLTREGMILKLSDSMNSTVYRLQLNAREFPRFLSFAFDHNKRVKGVESEPLVANPKPLPTKEEPPDRKETPDIKHEPRVVSQGQIGTRSKLVQPETHLSPLSLGKGLAKPLAFSTPLKMNVKHESTSSALMSPQTSPTRRIGDPTVLDLTERIVPKTNRNAIVPTSVSSSPGKEGLNLAAEEIQNLGSNFNGNSKPDMEPLPKTSASDSKSIDTLPDSEMAVALSPVIGKMLGPEPPSALKTRTPVKRKPSITYLTDGDEDDLESYLLDPDPEAVSALESSGFKPFIYTFNNGRSMRITAREACRLEERIFLDDTLIQFYFQLAMDELATKDEEYSKNVYLFNPFFFTKVSRGEDPTRFMGKHSVLNKKLLIMPIHLRLHWQLALIVNLDEYNEFEETRPEGQEKAASYRRNPTDPKISVVILNSLVKPNDKRGSRELFKNVRASINALYTAQNRKPPIKFAFDGLVAHVPQQTNGSDCGVYAVHFCQCILAKPREFVEGVKQRSESIFVRSDFWRPRELEGKRAQLSKQLWLAHDNSESSKCETAEKSQEHEESDDIEIIEHSYKVRRSARNML